MAQAHSGAFGGAREHWRGTQAVQWQCHNQLLSIWKVIVSESAFLRRALCGGALGFKVTSKDGDADDSAWKVRSEGGRS